MYNSVQFSDAFHAVVGDGVSSKGSRFSATVNGFTVRVGSGYALAAGRWLENDELLDMPIKASGDNEDRTDALVVQVDYQARKATLDVLVDVDPNKLQDSLNNEDEYRVVLYLIRIRRGATALTPDDITDVRTNSDFCGNVVPLSAISGDVLYVYNFLLSGIDREVDRVLDLSRNLVDKANEEIAKLDAAIQQTGGGPKIGELQTVRGSPVSGWLLCDGSSVPERYPALSELLSGTLPDISQAEDRYRTYIYAGSET